MSHISENTNFSARALETLEALEDFATTAIFPSHALILSSGERNKGPAIFKGIDSQEALLKAFSECKKASLSGKVWAETDMRAQYNPSRMKVIRELAEKLAMRLAKNCPSCDMPGWGMVEVEKGLECRVCRFKTEMVKSEVYGCVKCSHREFSPRSDGKEYADPMHCNFCNP